MLADLPANPVREKNTVAMAVSFCPLMPSVPLIKAIEVAFYTVVGGEIEAAKGAVKVNQ